MFGLEIINSVVFIRSVALDLTNHHIYANSKNSVGNHLPQWLLAEIAIFLNSFKPELGRSSHFLPPGGIIFTTKVSPVRRGI